MPDDAADEAITAYRMAGLASTRVVYGFDPDVTVFFSPACVLTLSVRVIAGTRRRLITYGYLRSARSTTVSIGKTNSPLEVSGRA